MRRLAHALGALSRHFQHRLSAVVTGYATMYAIDIAMAIG